MKIIPLTRDAAKEYVRENHRHNKPPTSHKFSLGLEGDDGKLVGVLIAGRPVARLLDDGTTLELTRVCTDGTRNACSMGFERIYTYTQAEEGGASMRAAGFVRDAELEPRGSWAEHSVAREGRNEDEWKQSRSAERGGGDREPVHAGGEGAHADDAGGERLEAGISEHERAGVEPVGLGGAQAAADADGDRLQGERHGGQLDGDRLQGERHGGQLDGGIGPEQRHDADGCDVSPEWSSIVGWASPQPAFRRVDDGAAEGLDESLSLDFAWHERVHLLGNGVVPQAAAFAWETLALRISS